VLPDKRYQLKTCHTHISAWYRLKFPHLTKGALSSSGVVNAILNFVEFDEQVATSVGEECANVLREAVKKVEVLIMAGGNMFA